MACCSADLVRKEGCQSIMLPLCGGQQGMKRVGMNLGCNRALPSETQTGLSVDPTPVQVLDINSKRLTTVKRMFYKHKKTVSFPPSVVKRRVDRSRDGERTIKRSARRSTNLLVLDHEQRDGMEDRPQEQPVTIAAAAGGN